MKGNPKLDLREKSAREQIDRRKETSYSVHSLAVERVEIEVKWNGIEPVEVRGTEEQKCLEEREEDES